ncbi:GNAT family N-acetyltransferase [Marinoscillum pacificum]|uniref:GNAT family N-acetyltransferase n=1 Tax=Marinoscillum pacificum TaxID=392723 RepID=UPI0021579FB0|nr:GNAT family N-acetyltransferase [Marinoscillum pacificum]
MNYSHHIKTFEELTNTELYDLLRLRSEVFVVEQNCVFLDLDDKDQACYHLLLHQDSQLAAYVRIVPAGVTFKEVSIGRVVTSPATRGSGLGRVVMERGIKACQELFGNEPIKIGAQCYALKFYNSLGFEEVGEVYDEDGIDHIHMILEF